MKGCDMNFRRNCPTAIAKQTEVHSTPYSPSTFTSVFVEPPERHQEGSIWGIKICIRTSPLAIRICEETCQDVWIVSGSSISCDHRGRWGV
jgi:hypothetical protein